MCSILPKQHRESLIWSPINYLPEVAKQRPCVAKVANRKGDGQLLRDAMSEAGFQPGASKAEFAVQRAG